MRVDADAANDLLGGETLTSIDHAGAERAVRDLLVALGRDLDDADLRDTPRRVAAAYTELLTHEPFSLTTFPNSENYDSSSSCAKTMTSARPDTNILR